MNRSFDADHQEVWVLLPWLVTGRLSEADRMRAEAHLGHCAACREEYGAQRAVHAIVAADGAVDQMPTAGLNKLRLRLEQAAAPDAPRRSDDPAVAGATQRHRAARLRASAIAASLLVMAIGVGIPVAQYWRHAAHPAEGAPYYTVTSAAAPVPNAAIRVVFAPTLPLSDLNALLESRHLTIVSGPTEAGVYSLAMADGQSMEATLRSLRASDAVRFAEPVAGVASAIPRESP
jgi:Putative zinc-finger